MSQSQTPQVSTARRELFSSFELSATGVHSTFCVVAALTSLKTILGVNVSFMIDGQTVAGNPLCTSQGWNSPCMPKVHAAQSSNKVVINYAVLSNATVESPADVILKACYDKTSTIARSWRTANNLLVVSSRLTASQLTLGTWPPYALAHSAC